MQTIPNAIQALEPAARIADIMDKKSKIEPNPEQPQELIKPERFTGQIEFRDVRFSYPTLKENRILDGLSFTVEPGTKVALVGSAGCGKSSVMRLLQVIPPLPSLFTLLRSYLAHFFPVFSRFLRVFTVSPRRFQRAASRKPGPGTLLAPAAARIA